jgi:hypothetical protein
MTSRTLAPDFPRTAVDIALRVGVVVALAVDAVIHWRLAGGYDVAYPGGIGGGNVFRIEAVVAVLAALFLLWRGTRLAWGASFAVLASAFVAVVLYRYVEVPQIGPIPSMYEPVWFAEKTYSAVAEGVGAVLAAVGMATSRLTHSTD